MAPFATQVKLLFGTQVDIEVCPLDGPLLLQLKIVLLFKTGRLLKWIAYPARRWSREWDKAYENAICKLLMKFFSEATLTV